MLHDTTTLKMHCEGLQSDAVHHDNFATYSRVLLSYAALYDDHDPDRAGPVFDAAKHKRPQTACEEQTATNGLRTTNGLRNESSGALIDIAQYDDRRTWS